MTCTVVHRLGNISRSGYVNPSKGEWNGFKYVSEIRHMFGKYYTRDGKLVWQNTPQWAIEIEQYSCGFLPPHYPLPAVV